MDQRVVKLNHYIGDAALAAELVEAGLGSPKKIKKLSRSALEKRIGKSKAGKVRGKIR